MIRLTTNRLIIRDPLPLDIDDWHRLLSDPKTMYYLQDIMTNSLEESRKNLETAIAETQSPNRTKYFLAIEDKVTGAFIGTVGYTITNTTPIGKVAGAGYFILPEYHGKGIMTEAFREVIRFAFEDDNVYRIETGCLIENKASERVMQKCGLIKEAECKAYDWHDGSLKDRVEYRLLRDEWMASNRKTENYIGGVLTGDAKNNAEGFFADLSKNGMQFERGQGYWFDKRYWMAKYKNEYMCFILLNGYGTDRHKDEPEGWVIWMSDNGFSNLAEAIHDERTKEIAWNHIDICGKCGGCENPGGNRKQVFGKEFDNVCITPMRFDNPNAETVECVKMLVGIVCGF